jgi:hypothetical protein
MRKRAATLGLRSEGSRQVCPGQASAAVDYLASHLLLCRARRCTACRLGRTLGPSPGAGGHGTPHVPSMLPFPRAEQLHPPKQWPASAHRSRTPRRMPLAAAQQKGSRPGGLSPPPRRRRGRSGYGQTSFHPSRRGTVRPGRMSSQLSTWSPPVKSAQFGPS